MSDRALRASQRDFEAFARRICDPAGGRYLLGTLLDYAALREALLGCGADLVLLPHEALLRTPAEALRRLLLAVGMPEAVPGRRTGTSGRPSTSWPTSSWLTPSSNSRGTA